MKNDTTTDRTTVTIDQAATLLLLAKSTVYKLIDAGVLTTVACGARVRVLLDSVDAEFARRYPGLVRVSEKKE